MNKAHAGLAMSVCGAAVAAAQPVQWRAQDGGNGHWYEVRTSATRLSWAEARAIAIAEGGDLASITTEGENQFVFHLTDTTPGAWVQTEWHFGPWIGGYRSPAGSANWMWVSGEPWSYSAWMGSFGCGVAQPDSSTQDFAEFGNGCSGTRTATWSDAESTEDVRSFVVEWTSRGCVDPLAVGSAVSFDGSTGYVSTPDSPSLDFGQQMTVEMWINVDRLDIGARLLNKSDGLNWNTDRSFDVGIWADSGDLSVEYFGGTLNTYVLLHSPGLTVQPERWYHLASTFDGVAGVARLYVDGQLALEQTASEGGVPFAGMHIRNSTRPLQIGRVQNYGYPGKIDEVRLWNVARTPAQIAASYHCQVPADSAGLAAYYRFDEGTGSVVQDLSGHGNTGALLGGASWVSQTPVCVADLGTQGGFTGHDGVLDNNDFVAFISLFFNRDTVADLGTQGGVPGSDGQFDNNDFVVFIDRFFAGC